MKFSMREIILVAVLLAIPVGAWQFVLRPRSVQAADIQKQIKAKQAKLHQVNRATAIIGDLKNEIVDLEKGIAFFQSKLPSEKEIDKVLEEVWNLAEINKLVAKSIRPLKRTSQTDAALACVPHSEQPIAVQILGDFMGFYSFLQSLENQPRIMRIQKLVLTKPKKCPEGYIQADFTMSVFFESPSKEKS